jgi:hypothetical protein
MKSFRAQAHESSSTFGVELWPETISIFVFAPKQDFKTKKRTSFFFFFFFYIGGKTEAGLLKKART